MNHIEEYNYIEQNELNQGLYFQSLFEALCKKDLITPPQIERIQIDLIELLGKEVERYTNWESTSVPVEQAQALLRSITYSIGVYLKSISNMQEKINILKQERISVLFYRGMDAISNMKKQAYDRMIYIQKNCLKVNNIAFQDTLYSGIPKFFHDYNIEYAADDIACSIDYPLLCWEEELLGVEYVYDYLSRLDIENKFLLHFTKENVEKLMVGFDRQAQQMLINIFELVLTNALGCELLEGSILSLNITERDRKWLEQKLKALSDEELLKRFQKALTQMGEKLNLEEEIINYASLALPQLVTRTVTNITNNSLNRLFLSFEEKLPETEYYEDGIQMEDEVLRDLIEELKEISSISDKLSKIRDCVRSLSDLSEILTECFYDKEYDEVFQLFSKAEIAMLKKSLREELGGDEITDIEPDYEWKKILLKQGE